MTVTTGAGVQAVALLPWNPFPEGDERCALRRKVWRSLLLIVPFITVGAFVITFAT